MLYRERVKRNYIIIYALLVLLISFAIIVWLKQRVKLISIRNQALIAEASSLRDNLVQQQTNCDNVTTRLRGTLNSRFAVIDELCQTYYESQGTKTERKAIVDKVKKHITELQHDAGLFVEMERNVNECCNNLLNQIRQAIPAISLPHD